MTTNLIWITPDAERVMGYIARVSNPANQSEYVPYFIRVLRALCITSVSVIQGHFGQAATRV